MIVRSTLSRGLSSIISKFDGIGHIVTTIHWSDGSTIQLFVDGNHTRVR
ncbi:hypothetical protein [Burkholderia seminalis]|nr:hypothetical protein [Burkholderia seminalis]MDN7851850.1 hypothetical protein [Burkholderia seminalis]